MSSLPLVTLDPSAPLEDLEALDDVVGDARVLAIGESAHDIHEFIQLRHRVLRYLVERHGFTAFALESSFDGGLSVERALATPGVGLDSIARSHISYGFGTQPELHRQLEWMRSTRLRSSSPRFYGIDPPGNLASLYPGIRTCLDRVGPDADDAELVELAGGPDDSSGTYANGFAHYTALEEYELKRLGHLIARLESRCAGDPIGRHVALGVQRLHELLSLGMAAYAPETLNPRHRYMAETVQWLLQREQRIVLAAHNQHIQKVVPSIAGRSMGCLLADQLGDAYVAIATTYGGGQVPRYVVPTTLGEQVTSVLEPLNPPEGSLDRYLSSPNELRLHPTPSGDEANAILLNHDPVPVVLPAAFDAVVHVPRVRPHDAFSIDRG